MLFNALFSLTRPISSLPHLHEHIRTSNPPLYLLRILHILLLTRRTWSCPMVTMKAYRMLRRLCRKASRPY